MLPNLVKSMTFLNPCSFSPVVDIFYFLIVTNLVFDFYVFSSSFLRDSKLHYGDTDIRDPITLPKELTLFCTSAWVIASSYRVSSLSLLHEVTKNNTAIIAKLTLNKLFIINFFGFLLCFGFSDSAFGLIRLTPQE